MPRGDSSCGQCDGSTADFSRAGQAVYAQSALQLLPELHAAALLRTKVGAEYEVPGASPSVTELPTVSASRIKKALERETSREFSPDADEH